MSLSSHRTKGISMRWVIVGSIICCIVFLTGASFAQEPGGQRVEHLGFNVAVAPLDNVTLRQAIASAIDRQAIFEATKKTLPTGWAALGVAGSWFPPYLPQHRPDVLIHPYNPVAAKTLLTKAGFPDGAGLPVFEIWYRQDKPFGPFRQAEAEAIKAQLLAVGIKVRTTGFATGEEFFDRITQDPVHQEHYQMVLFAWGATKLDDDFLSVMFLQGARRNVYRYANPDVTLLLVNILKEKDAAKRVTMIRDAERLVLTDAPVVPLFYYSSSQ